MEYREAIHQLEPYMENLNRDYLKATVERLESIAEPTPFETAALGLTYHELCVVHYLRGKDKTYAPYAQKSFDVLTAARDQLPTSAHPIIDAYIVSARSLIASVKSNLVELIRVIRDYDKLVARDGAICYCPAFLQGSLLENLPNVFGAHKKAARRFKAIIQKHEIDPGYASDKIIGFCYLSLSRFEKNAANKSDLEAKSLTYDSDGTIDSILKSAR